MKTSSSNLRIKKLLSSGAIFVALFLFGLSSQVLTSENVSAYDFKEGSGLSTTGKEAGYDLAVTPDPAVVAGQVVQAILSVLGIIFLAFMIYAGITWMTAQGDDQKSMKAKKTIEGAITGLIVVIVAYAVSYFIINYFVTQNVIAR